MKIDTSRLTFDSGKHAYALDGTKLLTGVTSVISETSSKASLIQWAANMAVEAMVAGATPEEAKVAHRKKKESAGQVGTDLHALAENYIQGCIDTAGGEALPLLEGEIKVFADWAVENKVKFLSTEQRLYSETNHLAGTMDFLCQINGELVLGDIKTFPKMWDISAYHQMGAYSMMYHELTGQMPKKTIVVKICDPQDPRILKYKGLPFAVYERHAVAEDIEGFMCRLKLYRQMQNFTSPN